MVFSFSKVLKEIEISIQLRKPITGDFITVICIDNEVNHEIFSGKSSDIDKKICKYNLCLICNNRDEFDNLFPQKYHLLSKIIGITTSLGHFFTVYNTEAISIKAFNSYMKALKGFVFVDWEVVNKKRRGSQLLYLTDDKENEKGVDFLSSLYESGKISKITYEIGGNKGFIYCIESEVLEGNSNPFFVSLTKKINKDLSKRFPG